MPYRKMPGQGLAGDRGVALGALATESISVQVYLIRLFIGDSVLNARREHARQAAGVSPRQAMRAALESCWPHMRVRRLGSLIFELYGTESIQRSPAISPLQSCHGA